MKVLVLGSNGMAGHIVVRYLKSKGYSVSTAARSNADYYLNVEYPNIAATFFDGMPEFDYVINCVGLLVKDSFDRPDRAILINGWFPHAVEHSLKNTTTRLIHLSTDCVFDGKKGQYVETDFHTETNAYGRSKSIGEINNDKDVTFRMSIIGTELKQNGTGLLHWVQSNPNKELQGWDNAFWNGITTLQLAKCIEQYMRNPNFTGVYHLVNNDNSINKYDLVSLINDVFQLNKTIIRTQGPKPVNKILIDTRKVAEYSIPDYTTQLTELRDFQ